jgi:hypothetical protein
MAKPISATLKILLYGDKGKSLALLHQLELRKRKFINTAPFFSTESKFAQCQLAGIHVGDDNQVRYVSFLSNTPYPITKLDFVEWWNTPIVRDMRGRTFSRLQLVQEVRDTDGGGHLDSDLNESYFDFKSGSYMGWKQKTETGLVPIPHPHLACLRQIAHETLLTLKEIAPYQFKSEYIFPANPMKGCPGVVLFDAQAIVESGEQLVAVVKVGKTELIGEI